MAQAYLKGELGLVEAERATPAALRWVTLAAENDYLPAIDALIAAYSSGNSLGVAANRPLAEQYQAQANKLRNVGAVKAKKKPRRGRRLRNKEVGMNKWILVVMLTHSALLSGRRWRPMGRGQKI